MAYYRTVGWDLDFRRRNWVLKNKKGRVHRDSKHPRKHGLISLFLLCVEIGFADLGL